MGADIIIMNSIGKYIFKPLFYALVAILWIAALYFVLILAIGLYFKGDVNKLNSALKSAKNGDANSQIVVANHIIESLKVRRSGVSIADIQELKRRISGAGRKSEMPIFAESRKWYEMAAMQNNELGMLATGIMYCIGAENKEDLRKAKKWLTKVVDKYDEAKYFLAETYYLLDETGARPEKSMNLILELASAGNIPTINSLGDIYKNEYHDYSKSAFWYKRASTLGSNKAKFNLALMIIDGKVEGNIDEAKTLLKEVATNAESSIKSSAQTYLNMMKAAKDNKGKDKLAIDPVDLTENNGKHEYFHFGSIKAKESELH